MTICQQIKTLSGGFSSAKLQVLPKIEIDSSWAYREGGWARYGAYLYKIWAGTNSILIHENLVQTWKRRPPCAWAEDLINESNSF